MISVWHIPSYLGNAGEEGSTTGRTGHIRRGISCQLSALWQQTCRQLVQHFLPERLEWNSWRLGGLYVRVHNLEPIGGRDIYKGQMSCFEANDFHARTRNEIHKNGRGELAISSSARCHALFLTIKLFLFHHVPPHPIPICERQQTRKDERG